MDVLILIGRILFALLFLGAGIMAHLKATDDMAGWSMSRGLPAARPLVLVSGLWIVVGSLFVILGVWADLGFLMLAAFALAAAFLVHNFWRDTNPMEALAVCTGAARRGPAAGRSRRRRQARGCRRPHRGAARREPEGWCD